MINGIFKYVNFDRNNPEHLEKFHEFYEQVYSKAFIKDEISAEKDYLKIIDGSVPGVFEYKMEFFENNGRFIACFMNSNLPELKSILGEYSCVDPEYRGIGLSTKLIRNSIEMSKCQWMFSEIEKDNDRNKKIWDRFGFFKIPVDYTQFSLGEGKNQLDNLFFCVKPVNHQTKVIDSSLVRKTIWLYYRYAQLFSDPTNTEQYIRVLNSTNKSDKLVLEKLI